MQTSCEREWYVKLNFIGPSRQTCLERHIGHEGTADYLPQESQHRQVLIYSWVNWDLRAQMGAAYIKPCAAQARTESRRTVHRAGVPLHATWWRTSLPLPTDPGELGAHVAGLLHQVGAQHVLGTLGVDVAVSSVQGLCLVHHPHRFVQVTAMLPQHKEVPLHSVALKKCIPPPCTTPTKEKHCHHQQKKPQHIMHTLRPHLKVRSQIQTWPKHSHAHFLFSLYFYQHKNTHFWSLQHKRGQKSVTAWVCVYMQECIHACVHPCTA